MMNSTVAHISGSGWSGVISTTLIASAISPGDLTLLIVALLIVISSLIQLMLMIVRIGLLVVLTGTLPLAPPGQHDRVGPDLVAQAYRLAGRLAAVQASGTAVRLGVPAHPGHGADRDAVRLHAADLVGTDSARAVQGDRSRHRNLGAGADGQLAVAAAGAMATGAIRAGLHKPPIPATNKSASAPDDNRGPSGAEDSTPTDPPTSPSSPSAERRSAGPTGTTPYAGENDNGPMVSEQPNSRWSRATRTAATFTAVAAAGMSPDDASWRSRTNSPDGTAPEGEADSSPHGRTKHNNPAKPRPVTDLADGGPSGADDPGNDAAQQNGD
jgi:hypothetical protein